MPSWITCLFSAEARAERRRQQIQQQAEQSAKEVREAAERAEKSKMDMVNRALARIMGCLMDRDYLGMRRLVDAELAKRGDNPDERAAWLVLRAKANLAMGERVSCITDLNEVLGMGPGSPVLEMTKSNATDLLKEAQGTE